jgi:hypothetical protein
MTTAYLIDIDDVLVRQGTREFLPGAEAALLKLTEDRTAGVFFFSCWAFTPDDVQWLTEKFPRAQGFIRKPLADRYVFIDDKLDLAASGTSLCPPESNNESSTPSTT